MGSPSLRIIRVDSSNRVSDPPKWHLERSIHVPGATRCGLHLQMRGNIQIANSHGNEVTDETACQKCFPETPASTPTPAEVTDGLYIRKPFKYKSRPTTYHICSQEGSPHGFYFARCGMIINNRLGNNEIFPRNARPKTNEICDKCRRNEAKNG